MIINQVLFFANNIKKIKKVKQIFSKRCKSLFIPIGQIQILEKHKQLTNAKYTQATVQMTIAKSIVQNQIYLVYGLQFLAFQFLF